MISFSPAKRREGAKIRSNHASSLSSSSSPDSVVLSVVASGASEPPVTIENELQRNEVITDVITEQDQGSRNLEIDEASDEGEEVPQKEGEDLRGCCSCFKCHKIGKMLVLCECAIGETKTLRWIAGPYWNMLFMTYFVLLVITVLIYGAVVPKGTFESVFGIIISCIMLVFLTLTAFRDPGVFPRHTRPLGPNWSYSGQAGSFRPPGTIFCKETDVLIEGYDHFCPWSGTVIGAKNLVYFDAFVISLVVTMAYDVGLVVFLLAKSI